MISEDSSVETTETPDRKRRRTRSTGGSFRKDVPLASDPSNKYVHCRYCSGTEFRRSRLRSIDWAFLLLLQYPVRCLRCRKRQSVDVVTAVLVHDAGYRIRRKPKVLDPNDYPLGPPLDDHLRATDPDDDSDVHRVARPTPRA